MKPNKDRCPVVLAGTWNVPIFSPQWVEAKLGMRLSGLPILVQGQGFMVQFENDDVTLQAWGAQVQILPRVSWRSNADAAVRIGCLVLDTLSHTPMTGLGINFGFDVAEQSDVLNGILAPDGDARFTVDGMSVAAASVTKRLLRGTAIVNLTVSREGPPGSVVRIDINDHHPVSDAASAAGVLRSTMPGAAAAAEELVVKLFGLHVKEGE